MSANTLMTHHHDMIQSAAIDIMSKAIGHLLVVQAAASGQFGCSQAPENMCNAVGSWRGHSKLQPVASLAAHSVAFQESLRMS